MHVCAQVCVTVVSDAELAAQTDNSVPFFRMKTHLKTRAHTPAVEKGPLCAHSYTCLQTSLDTYLRPRHVFDHWCGHSNATITTCFYTQAQGIIQSPNADATLPVSESACKVTLPEVVSSA